MERNLLVFKDQESHQLYTFISSPMSRQHLPNRLSTIWRSWMRDQQKVFDTSKDYLFTTMFDHARKMLDVDYLLGNQINPEYGCMPMHDFKKRQYSHDGNGKMKLQFTDQFNFVDDQFLYVITQGTTQSPKFKSKTIGCKSAIICPFADQKFIQLKVVCVMADTQQKMCYKVSIYVAYQISTKIHHIIDWQFYMEDQLTDIVQDRYSYFQPNYRLASEMIQYGYFQLKKTRSQQTILSHLSVKNDMMVLWSKYIEKKGYQFKKLKSLYQDEYQIPSMQTFDFTEIEKRSNQIYECRKDHLEIHKKSSKSIQFALNLNGQTLINLRLYGYVNLVTQMAPPKKRVKKDVVVVISSQSQNQQPQKTLNSDQQFQKHYQNFRIMRKYDKLHAQYQKKDIHHQKLMDQWWSHIQISSDQDEGQKKQIIDDGQKKQINKQESPKYQPLQEIKPPVQQIILSSQDQSLPSLQQILPNSDPMHTYIIQDSQSQHVPSIRSSSSQSSSQSGSMDSIIGMFYYPRPRQGDVYWDSDTDAFNDINIIREVEGLPIIRRNNFLRSGRRRRMIRRTPTREPSLDSNGQQQPPRVRMWLPGQYRI